MSLLGPQVDIALGPRVMPASPPRADIGERDGHVRFVSIGDIDGFHVVAKLSSTYQGSGRPCGGGSLQWRGHLSGPATEDVQGKQNGKGDPNSSMYVADPSA
jgi:hypothetical protein